MSNNQKATVVGSGTVIQQNIYGDSSNCPYGGRVSYGTCFCDCPYVNSCEKAQMFLDRQRRNMSDCY